MGESEVAGVPSIVVPDARRTMGCPSRSTVRLTAGFDIARRSNSAWAVGNSVDAAVGAVVVGAVVDVVVVVVDVVVVVVDVVVGEDVVDVAVGREVVDDGGGAARSTVAVDADVDGVPPLEATEAQPAVTRASASASAENAGRRGPSTRGRVSRWRLASRS